MSKKEALRIMKSGRLKFGDEQHIEAARVIDFQEQLEALGGLECNKCGGSGKCECCESECGHCDGEGTLDGQHSNDLEKELLKAQQRERGEAPVIAYRNGNQASFALTA